MTRRVRAGEILFSEHDKASGLYVIAEGEFRLVRQDMTGREQVLSTEGPGSVLAVVPVFSGGQFYSTTIAHTDAIVLCIPVDTIQELWREHPGLLWKVAQTFAVRLREYAELIETLALKSVDQRLARYLASMYSEQSRLGHDSDVLAITITRTEMASRIGTTREVISRAFSRLQRNGVIKVLGARTVKIVDLHSLRAFAGINSESEYAAN